jgi:hypothetical protein
LSEGLSSLLFYFLDKPKLFQGLDFMSMRDVIEDLETGCVRGRYRDNILEHAEDVGEYFDSFEHAAEFVKAYEQEYDMRNPNFDPEDYAESWYDSFGDMEGIVDSLR